MPLTVPELDDRTYQQLLDDALARIPSHNPEWTSFNASDPGVTMLEVFAFLTETLLYRSNQIPERNRRKFLQLLGIPLSPASAARGVVQVLNERGPLDTVTLPDDVEVRAGEVPFRSERGLDVLPVEARIFYKARRAASAGPDPLQVYYDRLYATERSPGASVTVASYQTVPFAARGMDSVDLADAYGNSLWMCLLVREADARGAPLNRDSVRDKIKGRTLSVGFVPVVDTGAASVMPAEGTASQRARWEFRRPKVTVAGAQVSRPAGAPEYVLLESTPVGEVWREPGVIDIQLPGVASEINVWNDLEPLEAGVGDHPPDLEDSALRDRLITWIKITPVGASQVKLAWVGINVVPITQRIAVRDERVPGGTGEPDQERALAHGSVLPETLVVTVKEGDAAPAAWRRVDDLYDAAPEIPVADPRFPPGTRSPGWKVSDALAYTLDPEAGRVRFGDGLRGRRPPPGAALSASYAYAVGRAGNVGAGAVSKAVGLPPGLRVTNPVSTWGGADAETVTDGERRITRHLRHRDRLVTEEDFVDIVRRTPGADLARVDVLPAYHPELGANEPGDVPGVVTLMVIPRYDPLHPDTPEADAPTLDAVACWLAPRRLITTELALRKADYRGVWISVGIEVAQGASTPVVREAVVRAVRQFLSPLPVSEGESRVNPLPPGFDRGYPLRRALRRLELVAEVGRCAGVAFVRGLLLAGPSGSEAEQVEFRGLELPRVVGLSVSIGDPVALSALRGESSASTVPRVVPVPAIPEEC